MKTLKKKFKIYDPKVKEECAVFGISNSTDASKIGRAHVRTPVTS